MRRLLIPLAVLLIALAAGACAGSSEAGWTYAPPTAAPPATPVPSAAASEVPSEAPAGDAIQLSALNIQWEQTELSAPANTAFTIHFNNKDQGVPHDVVIKDAGGMEMFKGDRVDGPAEVDYEVPALPAGTYTFTCSFHPNMVGTLTVG
jgi:plastocyanin